MQQAFESGHDREAAWLYLVSLTGITIVIQHASDTVLVLVTTSTTNHKVHDAFFASRSDLAIAIGSAAMVIVVTLHL
jgi:hypothetical protein